MGKMFSTVVTGKVVAVGLHEASLADLKIGAPEEPALQIDSLRVGYSLGSIIRGKVYLIEINGLAINLEISEDGLRLPGFDPGKISGSQSSKEAHALGPSLRFDDFKINNGRLKALYEGKEVLAPFALQVTAGKMSADNGQPPYLLKLQVASEGENVLIAGSFDLAVNRGTCSLTADSLDLQKFVFLLGEQGESLRIGKTTVKADAVFSLVPFQMERLEILNDLTSLTLETVPVSFDETATDSGKPAALQLTVIADRQQYRVTGRATLTEPIGAVITFENTTVFRENSLFGSGTATWSFMEDSLPFTIGDRLVTVIHPPAFKGNFSFDKDQSGAWQASMENQPGSQPIRIVQGNNRLTVQGPAGKIAAKGSSDIVELQFAMQLKDLRVERADSPEITLPAVGLQGSLKKMIVPDAGGTVSGNFALESPGMKIQRTGFTGKADIALAGRLIPQEFTDIGKLKADGELIINNAFFADTASEVAASQIEGRIPWQLFNPDHEYPGKLNISKITWRKNDLGTLQANIALKDLNYSWSGRFFHSLPSGLVTGIKGQARIADSGVRADMHIAMEMMPFMPLQLGRLSPALTRSTISGALGLKGDFLFDEQGFQGNFGLELKNGRLEFSEKKYFIDNISASLEFPSLPALRSAPAQTAAFDRASIGDIVFEKGRVTWQLESPSSVLIDDGEVNWAGGRISTREVRISPDKRAIAATIYCDELLLTEILAQAGVKNASGEGTVSGRLPLRIGKNTIDVNEGLLYSSPEHGGFIRLSALDVLSAGIPKNTPQFAQIDFAAEALKNFQYNWVRLLLNSEGEDLVMQMQMDGRPVKSLPFRYDSQTGMLRRSADGEKGIDQPIRLDVNFRLPLNRLLGYSGKIQEIWDKIK